MTDPTQPLVNWQLPTELAEQIGARSLWVTEDTPEMFELADAFDAGGFDMRSEVEGLAWILSLTINDRVVY